MPGTKHLYDTIRSALFGGHLTQNHVDGIEAIISAAKSGGVTDNRQIAYMLATVYHECGRTMQPVRENGRGAGHPYGQKLKMGGGPGHRVPYTTPDQIYYGRGYVQLTWYENYESMGKLLHIDLLNNPDLALKDDIAAQIMVKGMTKGIFTGVNLDRYFNVERTDWVNARKIINGLDMAEKIAGNAKLFYKGLTRSGA
ncbi:putative chitinase [Mucilaginibacter oryzae]|uniref:Putative chitinase n=1 Tax=Mucilaginibacter oryzae TaxID=468058 RepID=A0A316H5Y6_9SPHI|nr:glycoside hydrolase family 19 protein [Mucilaginibacter oryzae]PWK75321.1 putative chitinase [Mucilaginibacter oryzae]